jgi:long-chain fatty acid transport protein
MRSLKIAFAATLLLPLVALANGYDVPNTNPRDLSMAGSLTAAQTDAAATYANPAALSKLQGLNVNGALSLLSLDTKWTGDRSEAGQSSKSDTLTPPPSLYVAYGFPLLGRNAGVGLGMNIPGGGNVKYPNDWAGRGRIIIVDRKIFGFYLAGGYEPLPQLRLGAGLVYYYGREYLKQGVQPFNDAFGALSTKGGAVSFDLSAEYTLPVLPLTIAADYKHKATMKLKGNGHFEVPEGSLPGGAPPPVDQGVKHSLTYPSVLNVGLAYRLQEPWLATFGFTWTGYSVYQADTFVGDRGTTITVPRKYKDGYTFRLGSEYQVTPKVQVRAGVLRDISGLSTDVYSATLPDSNAWAGALGGSWSLNKDLALQAAFFYAWLDKVKVTGTTELPGSYKTRVWIASAGVVWRTDLGGGK